MSAITFRQQFNISLKLRYKYFKYKPYYSQCTLLPYYSSQLKLLYSIPFTLPLLLPVPKPPWFLGEKTPRLCAVQDWCPHVFLPG